MFRLIVHYAHCKLERFGLISNQLRIFFICPSLRGGRKHNTDSRQIYYGDKIALYHVLGKMINNPWFYSVLLVTNIHQCTIPRISNIGNWDRCVQSTQFSIYLYSIIYIDTLHRHKKEFVEKFGLYFSGVIYW